MGIFKNIRNYFFRKYIAARIEERREERRRLKLERLEQQKIMETYKHIKNIQDEFSAAEYIQYECSDVSNGWKTKFSYINERNAAELLMYERIKYKYGDSKIDIEKVDVPWPLWNNNKDIEYISIFDFMNETEMISRTQYRRLYYKVKEAE